jgi:2-polyprenyl-6-hydroxyphenyl methylase/3-demethylubiquinone-9 3-methyltransferase
MKRSMPLAPLMRAAALARIGELRRSTRMTTPVPDARASVSPWALGDYHRFAKATIWEIGEVLVEACEVRAGQRVLDVAAGTGNTAIRAALRGARVVASDITPQNFAAGRTEAAANGVEIEWAEADAQALPFADGEFDVVTSSFGAIFAPDHQAVADELVRVCRPGGVIGMTNFTPDGVGGAFFDLFGRYMPSPSADALPPVLWGSEPHVRELFGDRVALETTRRVYTERAQSPEAYRDFFLQTFGPAVAISEAIKDDPQLAAQFDREFLDFAVNSNAGAEDGTAQYPYEYLLVIAHRLR